MPNTRDLVQTLWGLCNILRDDGITYHQYVNELSYLLFLKMAQEIGREKEMPAGFRWSDLARRSGQSQFDFYRKQLVTLGTQGSDTTRTIFANPTSLLRHAKSLNVLVTKIDELDWYSARTEGLGDLYEGLLEKSATEKKSGAGQYFTPRTLIESIVKVIKPVPGEMIVDPAAGTGGFLVVAHQYLEQFNSSKRTRYVGVELVQDTHRLLLMNTILHGMDGKFILADSLSESGAPLIPQADVILSNPPFGNKRGGGLPTRSDLPFPTINKQLAFLQCIYLGLRPGGRAAVVVPDNVLFERNIGQQVRIDLMNRCNLHTILRLPDGIFYANVKTNVLFISRDAIRTTHNTKETWIYDMRTGMPTFGKRTPLLRERFAEFELAYGIAPHGISERIDTGMKGRFRRFTRDEIMQRGENLDITWLKADDASSDANVATIEVLTADIRANLENILEEFDTLLEMLPI
jgi:type I restriction enzyme M protein